MSGLAAAVEGDALRLPPDQAEPESRQDPRDWKVLPGAAGHVAIVPVPLANSARAIDRRLGDLGQELFLRW